MQSRLKFANQTEYDTLSHLRIRAFWNVHKSYNARLLNDDHDGVEIQKNHLAFLPDFNATCIDLNISDNCMLLTGYMALYKVSVTVNLSIIFSIIFGIVIFCTENNNIIDNVENILWDRNYIFSSTLRWWCWWCVLPWKAVDGNVNLNYTLFLSPQT